MPPTLAQNIPAPRPTFLYVSLTFVTLLTHIVWSLNGKFTTGILLVNGRLCLTLTCDGASLILFSFAIWLFTMIYTF